MEGIGEIVAHNALLPAPVGVDSVAFLRIDNNIPGKPMELFILNVKSGEESRALPGFDFREQPSFTFAFEPNGNSFVVPRLVSGQWELLRYQTGRRQGEVLTELRDFRKEFPSELSERLKTRPDLLVTISDLAFSPSGERVVFNLALPNRSSVWMLNLNDRELRQITPDNVGYYAQVHPDEDFVYYTANSVREERNFDQDILKRSIVTGEVDTLVSAGAEEFGAVLSPDSKYLVYGQRKEEITDIWVKNLSTGEQRKLTATPKGGHCNFPRWSADGKWVYYQVAGIEDIPMTARKQFTEF
jgi:WD40 repeat protein